MRYTKTNNYSKQSISTRPNFSNAYRKNTRFDVRGCTIHGTQ